MSTSTSNDWNYYYTGPKVFLIKLCVLFSLFSQRTGSVHGEDLPYILGLPLIGGGPFFPHNYSHNDATISKSLIQYISNFVRKG